ncbi:hypothetical protein [Paenibacillus xanthanilyticus]|uniref:hypothetical protein n=1 Tax=Paenibacillus xanthanilyticus TaxID=1783531 RepID=UPI00363733ED
MKNNIFFVSVIVIFVVWITSFVFMTYAFGYPKDVGVAGDLFGAINSLFSGLALAGVIYTLYIQRRDSEHQIKPYLVIEPHENNKGARSQPFLLEISNIGNGAALNIELEPTPFPLDPDQVTFKSVRRILSLKPGEMKLLEIKSYNGDEETQLNYLPHLNPKYANTAITIKIKYNDIEYRVIEQKFDLGNGDLKLSKSIYK